MRHISVKRPPFPGDRDAYRAWESDYVGQLCPALPESARSHFRPRGLKLAPRAKTDSRIVRVLKADGWAWDASGLVWRNESVFLP